MDLVNSFIERRLLRHDSTAQRLIDVDRVIQSRKEDFQFEVSCKKAEKQAYGTNLDYVFEIEFKSHNQAGAARWTVNKSMTQMQELNEELEEYLGFGVHQFNQYIQPLWSVKDSADKQHRIYYSKPLFDFIEFDPERELHINSRMCTPRDTILSINDDSTEQPHTASNTLSNLLGLTDDQQTRGNVQMNSGLKVVKEGHSNSFKQCLYPQQGVNLQKEFNLMDSSERMNRSQRMFESRTTRDIVVYGVNLNKLMLSIEKIFTSEVSSSQFKNETKTVSKYLIFAEEFDTFGLVKMRVALLKPYSQILYLDALLQRVYNGIIDTTSSRFPRLPSERQPSPKNLTELKKEFETYFDAILRLPRIEENDTFVQFLRLHSLHDISPSYTSGVAVYDFTDSD